MSKWLYYLSGILYGIFEKDEDSEAVFYQWLDPTTSHFQKRTVLDENASKGLMEWANLDVLQALGRITEYEKLFAKRPTSVDTDFGDAYTQRKPDLYVQRDVIFPTDLLFKGSILTAFICPSREHCTVLVREGFEESTILRRWQDYPEGNTRYPVSFVDTFNVLMRDGIQLSTDVYLPKCDTDKLPAILVRTCYGKKTNKHMYYPYVQRGYAVVIQDVRGCGESSGVFIPMYNEIDDGDDTLNWIADQEWSNGKVGTIGGSYLGFVQWAMAASGNVHHSAMVSLVTAGSAFVDIPRRGGLFLSSMLAWAFAMSEKNINRELMDRDDWDELLNIRPLKDIAPKALGKNIPFLDKWLEHPHEDAFWKKGDWIKRSSGRQVPALITSGWFDDNSMGTTQALELTKDYPPGMRKVILGPWNHNMNTRYDINDMPMGENSLRYDLDLLFLQWFDHHIRDIENDIEKPPMVEYFTLSENCWKTTDSWPPPDIKSRYLYLGENGVLLDEPTENGKHSYHYDPLDPATYVIDMSQNEFGVPADYSEEEMRTDVISYTTPPLEKDVVITGDIEVILFFSSDAPDTDFIVRITEVDKNGRSIKYADGMISAKYRESFESPQFLKKDEVYKLSIRTTKISKLFNAGNRIRLTVTSSAKNFAFPNSNTVEGYDSVKTVVAKNAIYHGVQYPSHIILPLE